MVKTGISMKSANRDITLHKSSDWQIPSIWLTRPLITWAPYNITSGDELLGEALLHSRRGHAAELGYWISEEKQGQGIATKAVKRLAQFGFEE